MSKITIWMFLGTLSWRHDWINFFSRHQKIGLQKSILTALLGRGPFTLNFEVVRTRGDSWYSKGHLLPELKRLGFLWKEFTGKSLCAFQTENISESLIHRFGFRRCDSGQQQKRLRFQLRLKGVVPFWCARSEEQATRHLYRSIDCFSLTNSMQAQSMPFKLQHLWLPPGWNRASERAFQK